MFIFYFLLRNYNDWLVWTELIFIAFVDYASKPLILDE